MLKPVIVEAITFEELIEYGVKSGANIVNGMPWSFEYNGRPVSHNKDNQYLISTPAVIYCMCPEDMLITNEKGEIYLCRKDVFFEKYTHCPKTSFK